MPKEDFWSAVRPVCAIALVCAVAVIAPGCSASKKIGIKPNEHMEIGWTPRSIFQAPAYAAWFDTGYAAYQPETGALGLLKTMQDSVSLVVVYGTWCSDSRRELPRFWKIMDSVHFPQPGITMIAVDRSMEIPPGIRKQFSITNVPTFIVQYRGVELGRIVESPKVSLEEDLAGLLRPIFGK